MSMTNPAATAAATPGAAHPEATGAAEQLRTQADAFWDRFMAEYPTWATIVGDRRYDDRLEDISPDGVARRLAWLDEVATNAAAIPVDGLSSMERVTRQMLIDEAANQARSIRTRVNEWTVDPLQGPMMSLLDIVDYQTITTPEDGRNMVERFRGIGRYLDQMGAELRESAADGRVAVENPVEKMLNILDGLMAKAPETWKIAGPAAVEHEDWKPADLEWFRANLMTVVTEVAIPAFRRYQETLKRDIRPLARSSEKPGICHIDGGLDAYRDEIRVHTTLDLAPEEIHATGLAEIARIDSEFVELGARVLGTKGLDETLAALRSDKRLYFESADQVFEAAKVSLARAQQAVPDWFGRIPGAACVVVPVPSHSEVHQTIAYYSWPAMDGSRPGRYYINLYAPETRPRYEAEALAFHESVPGHHLQIAIAQELPNLPAFQRMLGSTAFAEGWGLYTERLCDEMGLYSSDMDRFGILSFDAWRAGRLVVDTGMHALGWTRQQAIDFLTAHTALGSNNIVNEVDRYIVWPGQALAYKTGQLEILRLRADARERLGDRFDIKAFHDTVLGAGAISLPALRGRVEEWITGLNDGGGSRPASA
ncbi:MAG TPA: DUF885 domain-containing protein [Candidatus Limnocylindrales bacterium]|nr:DUF885 domain-containing protein [Candidatus Limnocylindrales bacterium]